MARIKANLISSALASASYDDERQELDIQFTSGQTFTYHDVPMDVFEGLRDAPSPGSYFHQRIKDQFA